MPRSVCGPYLGCAYKPVWKIDDRPLYKTDVVLVDVLWCMEMLTYDHFSWGEYLYADEIGTWNRQAKNTAHLRNYVGLPSGGVT